MGQMPLDRTLAAPGFGDASNDIVKLYQPAGYYELIKEEYSTTRCLGGATECCGYNSSTGDWVQTVPFSVSTEGGATDKMDDVKDFYGDADCEATFQCGGQSVTAPCSDYD